MAALDDIVICGLGIAMALAWAVPVRGQPLSLYLNLIPLVVLFNLGLANAGLYPGFGLGAVETLRRLWLWSSFLFVGLAAGSFAFRVPHHYSRFVFLATWAGTLLLLPIVRFLSLKFLHRFRWWSEPTLVVGTNVIAKRTISALRAAVSLGYSPRWVLSSKGESLARELHGLPVLTGLAEARALAANGVRVALVAIDNEQSLKWLVPHLQSHFRHVVMIRSGHDLPVEGVVARNLGGLLGIELQNQLLRRRNRVVKRSMDLVLGSVGLLFAVPVILCAGIAIKLTDKGPAFYCQKRSGLHGELIDVCKLRTMFVDAEERLEVFLTRHPAARGEWERRFKLQDDPRILPRIGSVLRRWSIDELPQLWSVVKGDMSLVGPRPFPEYHLRGFPEDFLRLRQRVRPGLTGLWQVMVRSEGGVEEQELYDSYYVRNWSLWMDIYVLARTTITVISGRGAL